MTLPSGLRRWSHISAAGLAVTIAFANVLSAEPTAPVAATPRTADTSAEPALAERLAKVAQNFLARKDVQAANFRQAAAFLQAAVKLSPNEPRLYRLLIEAQLQLRDTAGAIQSLEAYTALERGDQVARLQLIDLYVAQMDTVEKRIAYLDDLLQNTTLFPEFRSAVAMRAAQVYLERDQKQQAMAMLDQALSLNPLNPEACQMNLARQQEAGTPATRAAASLAVLRANPAEVNAMNQLANELAAAGLHDDAQRWFNRAFDLQPKIGRPVDRVAFLDAAISSLVLGQAKTAEGRALSLVGFDPSDFDAHLVRLLAIKRLNAGEAAVASAVGNATDSLVNRINALHEALDGKPSATTQPTGELVQRLPDPLADAQALKAKGDAQLADAYANAMSDLAWVTMYFAGKPADAEPLIGAMRILLPENSVVVSRLEGWQLLLSGKTDEAAAKFGTIADRDPISAAGLIRIKSGTDASAAFAEAQTLVDAHPSGLLGAILIEATGVQGVRPRPNEETANAVSAELAKFPMKWLDILETPAEFYSITASAGKVPFAFGEPILVKVQLRNGGNFPIALGPNGAVKPDLWVDCTMKVGQAQQMPGVAFERLNQRLLLSPGQFVEQTIRIDQGQLWNVMQSNPGISFPLYFSILTNPVPGQGGAAPGPGGFRFNLRTIERQPVNMQIPQQREAVLRDLSIGDAAAKIRAQEVLAQVVQQVSRPEAGDQGAAMAADLKQAIEQGMADSNSGVRAWATYVTTLLSSPEQRSERAKQMATKGGWTERVLILTIMDGVSPEAQQVIFDKLANDEDPIIRSAAESTRRVIEMDAAAAATQPSGEGTTPDGSATPPRPGP